LDASKCGLTQKQAATKSFVENLSNDKIHKVVHLDFTTSQQPNQLQLSFINVNTKPEGDWTPVNVDQHDSRPAFQN
jgi:glycerol-3-phosphate responsive antiterminator